MWRYPYALLGIVFILIGVSLWPRHTTVPVLIYHNIATSTQLSDSYTVEASLLSRELDYLQEEGYTPLTFAATQTLAENNKLPERPIVITFDDALVAQYWHALPLLRARDISATFFITSGLVDTPGYLSWRQVRALSDAGMEIGGHSRTHAHLLPLTDPQLVHEVTGDKTNIERELGRGITVFAFPYQEHDARTDAAVQAAGYSIVRDDTIRFNSTVMTNSFDEFLKAL